MERMLQQVLQRLEVSYCSHGLAARGVSSTGLTENSLPVAVLLQELDECLKDGDVVL